MKKQAGFTLIELVIVIIILGILAVTAAPKFLNLQDDAKKAAANGVLAAVQSSAQLVYSRAAVDGIETSTSGSVSVAGGSVAVAFGYPTAADAGIKNAVTLDGSWEGKQQSPNYIFAPKNAKSGDNCVLYTAAADKATAAKAELKSMSGATPTCQ
ncbi:prepilin-type N-terminal cleavage/methylation domain-containing protein [Aeromonas veronii]